jgi:hypothetical protein
LAGPALFAIAAANALLLAGLVLLLVPSSREALLRRPE